MKRIKGKPHYFRTIVNGKAYEYYIRKVNIEGQPYTITAKSKADFDIKLQEKTESIKSGASELSERNISFKDVAKEYLEDSQHESSGTYIRRKQYLDNYLLPNFKNRKIRDINHNDVRKLYFDTLDEKKSITLVQQIHKVLNTLFDFCVENNIAIIENPIGKGIIKSVRKRAKREEIEEALNKVEEKVTKEDILNILEAVKGTRQEIIYHLQILSGLRISEALAMTFENIDMENNLVNVTKQVVATSKTKTKGTRFESNSFYNIAPLKTKSSIRVVPLMPQTKALVIKLKELLGRSTGLLFETLNKSVCGSDNWNKRHHKPLMERLGISIKTHTLRKFFGSYHIENGTAIQDVKNWLGHSELATTLKHYSDVIKRVSNNKYLMADFDI